jgi:hypothetical protein
MFPTLMRRIIGRVAPTSGTAHRSCLLPGFTLAMLGCALASWPSEALARESLRLPNAGIVLDLPDNNAGWKVMRSQTGLKGDLLARHHPSSPLMSINVEVARMQGKGCKEFVAKFASEPKTHAVQSPPYLPSQFYPTAAERTLQPGTEMTVVCVDITGGVLAASVVYDGALTSADFRTVKPLLTALGQAAGKVSPPPAPAPPPPSGPKTVTFPTTGLTITVPAVWELAQKEGTDGLVRTGMDRLFGIALTNRTAMHTCGEWETAYRKGPGCTWMTRPGFAPARYHPQVCDEIVDSTAHRGNMCLERQGGGILMVQVLYRGPLSDAIVMETKPIFESIATAANGSAPTPPAPTPAAPPAKTSTPALPPSPPPAPPSTHASPPPRSYDHDDDDDDDNGGEFDSSGRAIAVELGVHKLSPDDTKFSEALGGTIGLKGFRIEAKGPVGLAWGYNGAIGYQQQSNVPFDLNARVGVGIRIWRLQIAPLLGAGADALGGGDDTSYKIKRGFNYHVEGVATLHITGRFGISGSAGRYFRTGKADDPAQQVSHENRITGQLNYSRLSVGVRFVNYETAKQLGGTLGLSF